jgi:hypothetical protein
VRIEIDPQTPTILRGTPPTENIHPRSQVRGGAVATRFRESLDRDEGVGDQSFEEHEKHVEREDVPCYVLA